MSLSNIDLEKEFKRINSKKPSEHLLEEIRQQLEQEYATEKDIEDRIFANGSKLPQINQTDLSHTYREDDIRKICIKYRLRFLDASLYQSTIPAEALSKIRTLEQKWGVKLNKFKIVAPQSLFHLEDPDADPILFAQLTNDRYYFVHKWGGEMNRLRAIVAYPLRSFMHLFWTLLAMAMVFAAFIPTPNFGLKLFLWIHSFIALCALACVYVLGMRKNFSSESWNSKFH